MFATNSNCIQLEILIESFETKNNIIGAHGMLPILEVLETCKKREVILKLLRIVNAVSIDLLYLSYL